MNRVLPPENDEGWLGWHPSQTQKKQLERLLTAHKKTALRRTGIGTSSLESVGWLLRFGIDAAVCLCHAIG